MVEAYAKSKFEDAQERAEEGLDEAADGVKDFCDNSVVKVKEPWGLVLFILNILMPGVGTIISSFLDTKFNGLTCLFGAL